jgi:hypothetical protein
VAAEERQLVGSSAALVNGDDGKGTAAAGLPVDGDVFGVGLEGVSLSSDMVAWAGLTLIRLVSQAFLEMRRLS